MDDERIRALARAARAEAEAAIDVDADLAATIGRTPSDLGLQRVEHRSSRRPLIWAAAAAASVVVIAGVWVTTRSGDDDTLQTADPEPTTAITTPVTPEPSSSAVTTPSTSSPSASTSTAPAPSTTSPPTTAPSVSESVATIAVDVASPPPELELAAFATIPFDEESRPDVAVGELGVVVNQSGEGAIAAIGFSGQRRTIELDRELADSGLSNLVYGPGDVVYGLRPTGPPFAFEMVAVALSGDRAGEIVARSEPLDSATWVELPRSPFGHGVDGVVARARDVGATLIGYVDVDGAPIEWPGVVPHFATVDDQLVVSSENFAPDWPLEINGRRSPQPSSTGPAVPAPATDNRTVYATYLRPSGGEGEDELPVVAVLEPGGAGSWGSVPEGFDYLASDAAGTVFGRVVDGTLELSLLAGGTVNWRSLSSDGSGVAEPCVGCTQLVVGLDGVPVSYEDDSRRLVRHAVPPVETILPDEYGESPFLYHLGPDEVVYLQVAPTIDAEFAADVVAVTLAPDDAGREVGRWSGIVDAVGDSELVATTRGLVNVDCCGNDSVRPDPDAAVLAPWVDRNGDPITSTAPFIEVEVSYPALTVRRVDQVPSTTRTWTFEPGGDWGPRGMPWIVPTFDGGFVAATFGSGTTVARGWPDGTVETVRLDDPFPDALDPSGRFLVANDGFFVRVEPFTDRAEYWSGNVEVDGSGALSLPGLDAAVDVGPSWSSDPVAFGNAVAGRPAVNEIRSVDAEQRSEFEWFVTVTTSNLFDDSVAAVRWELISNRSDVDGRFRFVSGEQTTVCAPGRGHQDFRNELCV